MRTLAAIVLLAQVLLSSAAALGAYGLWMRLTFNSMQYEQLNVHVSAALDIAVAGADVSRARDAEL